MAFICTPGVSKSATFGETILRVHGSNTIGAELGPDIASRFLKNRGYTKIRTVPGAKENEVYVVALKEGRLYNIEIKAHGSSTSFLSLEKGLCDVGMASRRIKEKELAALAALGDFNSINNEHVLAIDAIAVIVNPKNPLKRLDVETIKDIFTGKVTNWKALGGKNSPIKVYARDDKSGTFDTFKSMVLKKTPLSRNAKRYESNEQLSIDVTADPNGIGFVGMPYVLKSKAIMVQKTKGASAYLPTTFAAAYEEYPLSRRLYLYTAEKPSNPLAREFAGFALSNQGQKSVAMLGFAKLSMNMEERGSEVKRFKNTIQNELYSKETLGGKRVNFNFRFQADGYTLDNRSQRDLQRFIRFLKEPDQYYYEPLLVGINNCTETDALLDRVVQSIGFDNFHVPPQNLCFENAEAPNGQLYEAMIEVWLRVVDDGA